MKKDLYQKLHDDPELHYNDANYNRSPGVRYYPKFKHWLFKQVLDYGAGRGQLVARMQQDGFYARGLEQVETGAKHVEQADIRTYRKKIYDYDIEDSVTFNSATCIDVLEHLDQVGVGAVLHQLAQHYRVVISTHSKSSKERGYTEELHLTQWSREEWEKAFEPFLEINEYIQLASHRHLWLCEGKA